MCEAGKQGKQHLFQGSGKVVHVDNFASLDVDDVELRMAVDGASSYGATNGEQSLRLEVTVVASDDKSCPKGRRFYFILHDGGSVGKDLVILSGPCGHKHAYVGKKRVKVVLTAIH